MLAKNLAENATSLFNTLNNLKRIRFSSWPGRSAKRVFALDVPGIHVFLAAILSRRGCPGHEK
jgi:hypothetical protein